MAAYWLKDTDEFKIVTYECSNCNAVSKERSTACPFCGKIMNGTRNKSSGFSAVDMLKDFLQDR